MSEIAVASLHFYPIKSWGRVEAQELELTPLGFRYDREWVLQDEKGKFVSQRTHPEMTLGVARVDRDTLIASAPGHGTVAIPLSQDPNAPEVPISIFKKPGTGFVQSSEVNQFFRACLKTTRLVRMAP